MNKNGFHSLGNVLKKVLNDIRSSLDRYTHLDHCSRIIPCIINVYILDICIGGMNMFNSIVIMYFYHHNYPNEAATWCLASDKYLISRIIPCIINMYTWNICIEGMNMFNSIVIMFFHHQNYSNEAVPWWYLASDKYLISRIQSGLVNVSWFSRWVL